MGRGCVGIRMISGVVEDLKSEIEVPGIEVEVHDDEGIMILKTKINGSGESRMMEEGSLDIGVQVIAIEGSRAMKIQKRNICLEDGGKNDLERIQMMTRVAVAMDITEEIRRNHAPIDENAAIIILVGLVPGTGAVTINHYSHAPHRLIVKHPLTITRNCRIIFHPTTILNLIRSLDLQHQLVQICLI
jgi:hypothetical protein